MGILQSRFTPFQTNGPSLLSQAANDQRCTQPKPHTLNGVPQFFEEKQKIFYKGRKKSHLYIRYTYYLDLYISKEKNM